MFELTPMAQRAENKTPVYSFTGLDRRERIGDGACREMDNLSSDALPCLTVRKPRGFVRTLNDPGMLVFQDGHEIIADNGQLLVDGSPVSGLSLTAGRKIWAVMGHRVCIWPDKVIYNALTGEVIRMELTQTGSATFTNNTLTFSSDLVFQKGDGVTIEGCTQTYNNRTVVVQEVDGKTLTVYDNVFQHGELGSDQPESWTEPNITLKRTAPDLDFVCEKDNRLWGTHGNAICCCKLGDPANWNVFNGLSTDAWDAEVGSDGAFTGIAAFSSHVIAFKEHIAHKVYGTKPSSLQVQVAHIEGVKAGCERSLVNINENILYMSHGGVLAYAGGTPDLISPQLSDDYTEAAAGRWADKYYLSAKRSDASWEFLVYDVRRNAWMREDDTRALAFAESGGMLYWITPDGLWKSEGDAEESVKWSATFGPFERVTAERETVARLHVLLDLAAGGRVHAAIRFDNGEWRTVKHIESPRERAIRIPFVPRRCERFSVRLSGVGDMTLRSIVRKTYGGSDQAWHNT